MVSFFLSLSFQALLPTFSDGDDEAEKDETVKYVATKFLRHDFSSCLFVFDLIRCLSL